MLTIGTILERYIIRFRDIKLAVGISVALGLLGPQLFGFDHEDTILSAMAMFLGFHIFFFVGWMLFARETSDDQKSIEPNHPHPNFSVRCGAWLAITGLSALLGIPFLFLFRVEQGPMIFGLLTAICLSFSILCSALGARVRAARRGHSSRLANRIVKSRSKRRKNARTNGASMSAQANELTRDPIFSVRVYCREVIDEASRDEPFALLHR